MDGWMEASPHSQYKTVQTDLSERTMRPARTAPLKLQAGECKGEGYVYVFYQLSDVGKDNFHLPLLLLLGSPHTRSPVHYKAKWQDCRVDDCLVCMASRKYSLNREKYWAKDLIPKPSRLEFGYCHKEVVVLTPMFTSLLPHFKKTAIALGTRSFLWCHTRHWKLFQVSDKVSVLPSKTATLFLCLYQTRCRFNQSITF